MRWLLFLSFSLGIAHGQPVAGEQTVEGLAAAGAGAYESGDYAKAVGFYIQANQLQPNAPLVYNIAVIYERKIKDPELAIQFYRRYLGLEDVDATKIPKVNARIQKLKVEIEAKKAAIVAPTPEPEPTSVKVVKVIKTPPPPPLPASSNTAPWLLVGTGAALTVAGALFGTMARSESSAFDESQVLDEKLDHRDTGERYALTADVLMGAGILGLGAGAIFLMTGGDDAVGLLPQEGGGLLFLGGSL